MNLNTAQDHLIALVNIFFFAGAIILAWAFVIAVSRFILTWPRLGPDAPRKMLVLAVVVMLGCPATFGLIMICLTAVNDWLPWLFSK